MPDDTIWQYVLGFTPSEIACWKADKRREEAVKIASVSESLRRAQLQAQRPTDATQNGNEQGITMSEPVTLYRDGDGYRDRTIGSAAHVCGWLES